MAFDPNDPDTKAALAAAQAEATEAATAAAQAAADRKVAELQKQLGSAQDALKAFDGLDAEKIRKLIDSQAEEEDRALLKAGEIDQLVEKRTARFKDNYDRAAQESQARFDALAEQNSALRDKALDAAVRSQAAAAGVCDTAVEDAVLRARGQFVVDDNGDVTAAEGVIGVDGKPLTLQTWLDAQRKTAPHWFHQATGTGARSNVGANTGNKKWGELTERERADMSRDDPAAFKELLKTRTEGK